MAWIKLPVLDAESAKRRQGTRRWEPYQQPDPSAPGGEGAGEAGAQVLQRQVSLPAPQWLSGRIQKKLGHNVEKSS